MIVLLTMARSRSSMTAEIFRQHGVFFGDSAYRPGHKRIGYNEHPWVKDQARKSRGRLYRAILERRDPELRVPGFAEQFLDVMREDGWDGESPIGVKVDVFCHDAFKPLNPIYVGLFRKPEAIQASCMKALGSNFDWPTVIRSHHDRLRELKVPMIDTDEVVAGEDRTLRAAFDICGLSCDREIVDRIVQYA